MNVLDFNDNTPVIKIAKFDLRMPSDARVGYVFFGFFTAVDADYNDTLTYRTMGKYATSERKEGRKEGRVLFNDAPNTFYLRLYDGRHNR